MNHAANVLWIFEVSGKVLILPSLRLDQDGAHVALALLKFIRNMAQLHLFRRGQVNALRADRGRLLVLRNHVFRRVANLVSDTKLNLGARVNGGDGIGELSQTIHTGHQEIIDLCCDIPVAHAQTVLRQFLGLDFVSDRHLVLLDELQFKNPGALAVRTRFKGACSARNCLIDLTISAVGSNGISQMGGQLGFQRYLGELLSGRRLSR